MTDFIPVNEPLLDGNEKKYLNECIDTGWISSEGPFVERFEQAFAARVGRKHGIAVTNGTAALDAAVEALEIGPGDEVIVPTFTIISCVHQIVRCGAVPVFVDSDPLTWNVDVGLIEERITYRTRAIMAVHIYGLPVDMKPLLEVAARHRLIVIEDAAEAIGQTYRDAPCGSFGDVSTVSFYPNKHVTTGEGGMILTDNDALADRCRELRNLCFQSKRRFVHESLGWNLRMTNLQAAVGLAQLERLDEFLSLKRAMGKQYLEFLGAVEGIQLPLPQIEYAENIYWVFGVVLSEARGSAAALMDQLRVHGIGSRPFFFSLHRQPALAHCTGIHNKRFPVAERLSEQGLYIPSGLTLNRENIFRVAESLKLCLSD